MTHPGSIGAYISALINQPWARDGRHCWRLVREVQRDLFGRKLPVVLDMAPLGAAGARLKARLFRDHPERQRWREIHEPEHGAIAILRGQTGYEQHAGVYLDFDCGGVLHTDTPFGVVFDDLFTLRDLRHLTPSFLVPK